MDKKLRQRDDELNKGWGQFVHPLPIQTNMMMKKSRIMNKNLKYK